jgi:hypothetical protein
VVPRIVVKLGRHARVDGIAEDVGANGNRNGSVLSPEDRDLHGPA